MTDDVIHAAETVASYLRLVDLSIFLAAGSARDERGVSLVQREAVVEAVDPIGLDRLANTLFHLAEMLRPEGQARVAADLQADAEAVAA